MTDSLPVAMPERNFGHITRRLLSAKIKLRENAAVCNEGSHVQLGDGWSGTPVPR
jgi:hypothetical protein